MYYVMFLFSMLFSLKIIINLDSCYNVKCEIVIFIEVSRFNIRYLPYLLTLMISLINIVLSNSMAYKVLFHIVYSQGTNASVAAAHSTAIRATSHFWFSALEFSHSVVMVIVQDSKLKDAPRKQTLLL